MKEEVLHWIWKFNLIAKPFCYSTLGQKIQIVHVGQYNDSNSGPDFSAAKIIIDGVLWVGNVEVHINTSDWFYHGHQFDPNYANVILHVVYEHDSHSRTATSEIPILELKKFVNPSLWSDLANIRKAKSGLPCSRMIHRINTLEWMVWQDRLLVERFEKKVEEVEFLFKLSNKDWESTCLQLLGKSLGGVVNKEPFQILTKEVGMDHLRKNRNELIRIEALLYGIGGMLDQNFIDLYPNVLKSEFEFLKSKYKLFSMEKHWWKWLRLRPSSFPTLQISLLASLLYHNKSLEDLFLIEDYKSFLKLMKSQSCLSPYWENHFRFDMPVKEKPKGWGDEMIKRIFINAVIPYQILKRRQMGSEDVMGVLEKLIVIPPEKNKIVRDWKELGVSVTNAYESQALVQLTNEYCCRKKCLNCNIGLKILNRAKVYD